MTELENTDTVNSKRSPNFFKRNDKILYLYKNYVFNERIKDMIVLRYDLDKKENEKYDSASFNTYPEVPKKLSFMKCFKNRKAIENFIIYQYSKYADTFVERKILKETKNDVVYIYRKQQYHYFLPTIILAGLISKSVSAAFIISSSMLISYKYDIIGSFIFLLNLNDCLMKYQINTFYKLGRETINFVNYLEANRDEKNIKFSKEKIKYYDKFFVNDIFEIKFEKEDKIVDYLKGEVVSMDYHNRHLIKLETEFKEKNKN